jgi:hypothetical protein
MIHPDTRLKFINTDIGYGVFATAPIPKGTIVYVKDELDIEITKRQFNKLDNVHQQIVTKYSYIDQRGVRIVSWDHAKYVNHRCECNTMSAGYGFELAIQDIAENEEITDEYGLFNFLAPIEVNCGCTNCRKTVLPTDINNFFAVWDALVSGALRYVPAVPQPLWDIMDAGTKKDLTDFLSGQSGYRSVISLKYNHLQTRTRSPRRPTPIVPTLSEYPIG